MNPSLLRVNPWLRRGLALAAGALAATGFEPFGAWPLTILAVAVLVWLIDEAPNRRAAFGTGWIFGWGHFAVGLTWIATAFTYQAKMPAALGWVAVFGLAMFLALYTGLAALIASSGRGRMGKALLLASAWMLGEWLRGHLLSGFAWNPLGVTLIDTGVAQVASLFGGLGLSGLVVLMGGAVAVGIARGFRTAAIVFVAIGAAIQLSVFLVPAMLPPTTTIVHLVQPDIGQSEKYDPALERMHFQRYLDLTRGALAAPHAPAIVAWPEAAIPFDVENDPEVRAVLASVLKPGDLLLFGGEALIRDTRGEITAATNSLFVLDSAGKLHGRYDKAHLVPLGEYVPARGIMEAIGLARLTPGDIDFLPGPGARTLALPGLSDVGIQICYEMIFPAEVVDEAHRPTWILNVSNDAWFGPSGPVQHLAQARLRAIEEGLPVARATPTGVSALIDPRGRLLNIVPPHVMGVISAALPAPLPAPLFARFAHWTSLAFGLLLLAAAAWTSRRRI